jgi:hypothetical protein
VRPIRRAAATSSIFGIRASASGKRSDPMRSSLLSGQTSPGLALCNPQRPNRNSGLRRSAGTHQSPRCARETYGLHPVPPLPADLRTYRPILRSFGKFCSHTYVDEIDLTALLQSVFSAQVPSYLCHARSARRNRPRTLQGWMGHRDIASTMINLKGVRNSNIQARLNKGSHAAIRSSAIGRFERSARLYFGLPIDWALRD